MEVLLAWHITNSANEWGILNGSLAGVFMISLWRWFNSTSTEVADSGLPGCGYGADTFHHRSLCMLRETAEAVADTVRIHQKIF